MGLVGDRLAARRAALITFGLMTAGLSRPARRRAHPLAAAVFLVVHGFTVAAENVMLPLVIVDVSVSGTLRASTVR